MPAGPCPTGIVCSTVSVFGSIRETELSFVFTTHIDPAPVATASGDVPTGTDAVIRPVDESTFPTASAPTLANACDPPEPPPRANTGTATAAAITPISAAANKERRRVAGRSLARSAPRNGGNSGCRPSAATCEIRSGRSTSFNRHKPRSRRNTPSGRSSSARSLVVDDNNTCPPCAASPIRAARCTENPTYRSPAAAASPVWIPILTSTWPPSGHSWAASERWIATAASTASRALRKATKNESPCVSISSPPCATNASRRSSLMTGKQLSVTRSAKVLEQAC